jgi:hypothetical protein
VSHLFAYHWKELIPVIENSKTQSLPEDMEYFCFNAPHTPRSLGSNNSWEKIGEVVCDRFVLKNQTIVVIIGRLLKSENTDERSEQVPQEKVPGLE